MTSVPGTRGKIISEISASDVARWAEPLSVMAEVVRDRTSGAWTVPAVTAMQIAAALEHAESLLLQLVTRPAARAMYLLGRNAGLAGLRQMQPVLRHAMRP